MLLFYLDDVTEESFAEYEEWDESWKYSFSLYFLSTTE